MWLLYILLQSIRALFCAHHVCDPAPVMEGLDLRGETEGREVHLKAAGAGGWSGEPAVRARHPAGRNSAPPACLPLAGLLPGLTGGFLSLPAAQLASCRAPTEGTMPPGVLSL